MTNATMFVYLYGIVEKQGTSHGWSKVAELSRQNDYLKQWFESPYVQTANHDIDLLKVLDRNGL